MSLFEITDATVQYNGQPVLKGISLRIEKGERVALVGESGAGKTTLLKLLYGQRKVETSLLPQNLGLVNTLSVFHNVYMGRLGRHPTWYNLLNLARPMRKEVEAIGAVVRRLGLGDKLFTPAGELSGGQQQRTAVGRALHQDNRTLLGDEPVSAVDEIRARMILDHINEGHDTVVLALHDVGLALSFADRAIGIRDGRIVLDQPTQGMVVSDLDHVYRH